MPHRPMVCVDASRPRAQKTVACEALRKGWAQQPMTMPQDLVRLAACVALVLIPNVLPNCLDPSRDAEPFGAGSI